MMIINGEKYISLDELEASAKLILTPAEYGYYASGAETEFTLRHNQSAFNSYRLLPRSLVDVSKIDLRCEIFGMQLSMPVIIAPMAMQRMAHPDGELAMAAAAAELGTIMTLSTMATTSLEEVASSTPKSAKLWFQVYVLTRRDVTAGLVRDAEAAGYRALVVTIDAPRLGKRYADDRNNFSLPSNLSLKMLSERMSEGRTEGEKTEGSKFGQHFTALIDDRLTWECVEWLKSITKLPIFLKGILAPDDARKAASLGCGIIVSNHGGRQLDFCPATVDVLPFIVKAVEGKVPILIDGGIRRGSDVVKCIALGATAVLVGRPLLWALTLGGHLGVETALKTLREEMELTMALLGCVCLRELTPDYIILPGSEQHLLRIPQSRL